MAGIPLSGAWVDETIRLRQQGISLHDIALAVIKKYPECAADAHGYPLTETQVLRRVRCVLDFAKVGKPDAPAATPVTPATEPVPEAPPFKALQTQKPDGTIESIVLVELWDGEELTPGKILKWHKLDAEKWQVVSYTNNIWNAMAGKDRGNERVQMYQSKLIAKPKTGGITFEDIDDYFKNKVFSGKPYIIPTQYSDTGETLEVCVPDLHTGLLAWARETGADYDIHIARDAFIRCITDIKERCARRRFKRIYFVTLGDLLHTDNNLQTTTKGTFQQVDGRIEKIFDYALDMLIDALDILGEVAQVEIVYLSGNHDRTTGYMLIKSLEMAYRRDANFTFDVSPNPQKFRLIGCSLVGWTHGDMSKKFMGSWLQDRARKEYGLAKFAESHVGHLHSEGRTETHRKYTDESTYDDGGIVVRHLPTISNSSAWEHHDGYPFGTKTMMCFVWNEKTGLREMWYSNL